MKPTNAAPKPKTSVSKPERSAFPLSLPSREDLGNIGRTLLGPKRAANANEVATSSDQGFQDVSDKPKIGLLRKCLSYGLLGFGVCCILVLDQVDIVMNGSDSLEEPAFLMIEHPVLLRHGALVSAKMPDAIAANFPDMHFVKRIGGLPGETITLDAEGNPCINGHECFPLFRENGRPISPGIKPGVIPDKYYAVFGTSANSLDSRYSAIGLVHEDDLLGRGVAVSFAPDWRQ